MKSKNYYRRLDCIRIISCIMVLLYHLNILKGGFLAVCTFFALTGYLSCLSALKNDNFSIKKYYKNRISKIYIPLIAVVFITIILVKIIPGIKWLNLRPESLSVLLGYNNFWQLSANLDYFTRHINSPFMHLWYISILMQFELVFPIIFVLLKKISKSIGKHISTIVVFILLVVSTIIFYYMSKTQDIMLVYYNTFARSFSIIAGVFLALINHKYNIKLAYIFRKIGNIMFNLYAIILILLTLFISSKSSHYALYMILATFVSLRLIEYAVLEESRHGKANKLIVLLSKCSYEIYLVQYPVIFFIQRLSMNNYVKIVIIIILTLIISIILNAILSNKKNILRKVFKYLFIIIVSIFGIYILITEKDTKKEMKELEDKLNENSKMIEKKNDEYLNALNSEKQQWDEVLKEMENEEAAAAEMVKNLPIVGVGDSVLLGTIDELYKKFPNGYFDGKVSRSITGAEDLLVSMKNEGKLADTLILALANNGDYSDRVNKHLMDILGDRQIYWVNAVGADDPKFNDNFKEFAKNYSNIHIVDWVSASKDHPEYFYADGIHLKGDGPKAYADTIFDALCNEYLKEYKSKKEEILNKHEQELKNKIAFYGDEVLINSYTYINKKFSKSAFNTKKKYKFDNLYNDLNSKIENNTLEYKLVFILGKDSNISEEDYKKIIELCKNYKIYICNITDKKLNLSMDNVSVIDFYSDVKKHSNYMLSDKKSLSKEGNKALATKLSKEVK